MSFLAEAGARYAQVNRAGIDWMLARPPLEHGFLNTKRNSVTLRDYDLEDGLAGPDYLYGWIQTRGLDALVHHTAAAGTAAPESWKAAITRLEQLVPRLRDGKRAAYFCYDAKSLTPLRLTPEGPLPQQRDADIATPSDIYMASALAMADIARGGDGREESVRLAAVGRAISEKRFITDESLSLTAQTLAGQPDPGFSPFMTLLGAALSLARRGHAENAPFALPLIEHVLSAHLDTASGLLRQRPGEDLCGGGLSLEFAGFALGYCAFSGETGPVRELTRLAIASFRHCHTGMAIPTWTSLVDPAHHSGLFPWWPLVETIRAMAMGYALTGDETCLSLWQEADRAFFAHYWRPEAALAYQMRDETDPLQRAPATPDLDPGYHTGLSLLDAIGVVERLAGGRIADP